MSNSATLRKLEDGSRELHLIVDSTVIESLKWIWTTKVSNVDDNGDRKIALGKASHTHTGMPKEDTVGTFSNIPNLTAGVPKIEVAAFKSIVQGWEKECLEISSRLDSQVMDNRRDREKLKAQQEESDRKYQEVEDFLDSLTTDEAESS